MVLLLLPPSEGKTAPQRGRRLDLVSLTDNEALGPTRGRVLDALVDLCRDHPDTARAVLALPPGLAEEVHRDAALHSAPTALARDIYSGVLYAALGLRTLDASATRRANRTIRIVSALWGAVSPTDRIPAYRLSMDVDLPGIGPLAAAWRGPLGNALPAVAGAGLVVDLRSATYAAAWRPDGALAGRTVRVGVVRDSGEARAVVSHLAKHYRGQVARHLLMTGDAVRTPRALADSLHDRWDVELAAPARAGAPWRLALVVND